MYQAGPIVSGAQTPDSLRLRGLITRHRSAIEALFAEYGAYQPMLFGSVARGEAHEGSDLDILVRLDPEDGNILWRAAGLMEGLRELLGVRVDLFCPELMKPKIADQALVDAVAI